MKRGRNTIHLSYVEHGECPKQWNDSLAQVWLYLLRIGVRGGRQFAQPPEHDRRTTLAATHLAAQLTSLAVGQPTVQRIPLAVRFERQQQRVDAAIGSSAGSVDGHAVDVLRPWTYPRWCTAFQRGHDASGHTGVKIILRGSRKVSHELTPSRGSVARSTPGYHTPLRMYPCMRCCQRT